MKGLLLIGGQATRLHPLSKYMPKSLLPVCDRKVIHYQISQLALAGVSEIILAAGHLVEQLAAHVANYTGGLEFAVSTEPEALGTAGAIAHAADLVGDDQLVVLNADIISSVVSVAHGRTPNTSSRRSTAWSILSTKRVVSQSSRKLCVGSTATNSTFSWLTNRPKRSSSASSQRWACWMKDWENPIASLRPPSTRDWNRAVAGS